MKKRTDMAVEVMPNDYKYDVDRIISGMNLRKLVVDKNMSNKLGKREGIYYNLDNIDYFNNDKEIVKIISSIFKDYLNLHSDIKSILIVGLGNDTITPDSLGPLVINNIEVNRHLEHFDNYEVSAITPGVMGKTGMESSDIVFALVEKFKPHLVVVVDALACSTIDRMCHSIQISDAGINPGSGVLNHRKELSLRTLGVNVLAIGVPTVCDLSVFLDDMDSFFITPNNIDEAMDILASIIARGINKSLLK